MLYIRVEDEMSRLLASPPLIVAAEDAPFFEPLDALDECPRADLRFQGERPVGLLDPDTVSVDLAVSVGGFDQFQVHVLRRLAARARAPMLPPEFVVTPLQFLDGGPQLLVFGEPDPGYVLALKFAA
jgi:hypothetical protein